MSEYISVKFRETKEQLAQVLNDSKLPWCALQMILREIAGAVDQLAEQEYQEEQKKMGEEKSGKDDDK